MIHYFTSKCKNRFFRGKFWNSRRGLVVWILGIWTASLLTSLPVITLTKLKKIMDLNLFGKQNLYVCAEVKLFLLYQNQIVKSWEVSKSPF